MKWDVHVISKKYVKRYLYLQEIHEINLTLITKCSCNIKFYSFLKDWKHYS